jgi:hypothetical protein
MRTIALSMRAEPGALADVLFGKGGELFSPFYTVILINLSTTGRSRVTWETSAPVRCSGSWRLSRILGLVDRKTVGKQVFYRANRNHPIFPELRALVAKTVGAIQVLREALAPIADRVSIAFIYGSMARRKAILIC